MTVSRKGFGGMSKKKRMEVSKKGATARVKKGGFKEAGKRGGEVTKATRGKEFYQTIGKKGGSVKPSRK